MSSINPNAQSLIHKTHVYDVDLLVSGILSGDVSVLSQAITLVESTLARHQDLSNKLIELVINQLRTKKKGIRIGISGVPGVGKSTFIEQFGLELIGRGYKIAVLAIDPSSHTSGGSILGDKTRMNDLSAHKNAYIRPSPSLGNLGGVAQKTRETMLLCELAGFEVVVVETVGVGQSEVAVSQMTDCFLLLMLAGAGDELQGIKRGIMELADVVAITKSDGQNVLKAKQAQVQYTNALHLFLPKKSGWNPTVEVCSAVEKQGINRVLNQIFEMLDASKESLFFDKNRQEQNKYWLYQTINEALIEQFYANESVKNNLYSIEDELINHNISPFLGAKRLLEIYFKNR